jgi:hypothetical protein
MIIGQFRMPDGLHDLMNSCKYMISRKGKLTNAEWMQLATLVLLYLCNEVTDQGQAEGLCGGPCRVSGLFGHILSGNWRPQW